MKRKIAKKFLIVLLCDILFSVMLFGIEGIAVAKDFASVYSKVPGLAFATYFCYMWSMVLAMKKNTKNAREVVYENFMVVQAAFLLIVLSAQNVSNNEKTLVDYFAMIAVAINIMLGIKHGKQVPSFDAETTETTEATETTEE